MQIALSLFMLFNLFFKQTCVESVHDRAPEDMQFMALKCKFCVYHRNIVSVLCLIINLGTHVRGLQYLVCLCVCVLSILAPRAIRRTNSSISDFSAIRA